MTELNVTPEGEGFRFDIPIGTVLTREIVETLAAYLKRTLTPPTALQEAEAIWKAMKRGDTFHFGDERDENRNKRVHVKLNEKQYSHQYPDGSFVTNYIDEYFPHKIVPVHPVTPKQESHAPFTVELVRQTFNSLPVGSTFRLSPNGEIFEKFSNSRGYGRRGNYPDNFLISNPDRKVIVVSVPTENKKDEEDFELFERYFDSLTPGDVFRTIAREAATQFVKTSPTQFSNLSKSSDGSYSYQNLPNAGRVFTTKHRR